MYTKVQSVSPQETAEWLSTKNYKNRALSEWTVAKYVQEMKRGRWKLSGKPLIFGKSGRLLDGQHRLKACVVSNMPFETVVVYGAEDHVFDVIDDGKVRTMADVLGINDISNPHEVAAGLRFIWDYATGAWRTKGARTTIATKQLMEKMLDKHRAIRDSAKVYATLRKRTGGLLLPPSLVVGLHYLFSLVDSDKADVFFTKFQSGLELTESDPVYALRQRLIGNERRKGGAVKLQQQAMYTYTVKAWNAYVKGKAIRAQHLFYDADKPMPEIEDLPPDMMKDLL
jgi:hypothetical protein